MKSTLRKNSKRDNGADNSSGTVAYMGPEMFTAHPNAVKATDIWALGVTIFEIAEGELPFCGQGGIMVLHGAASPEMSSNWSDNLKSLVYSCLLNNTWDRPLAERIKDFANDILEGKDVAWKKSAGINDYGNDKSDDLNNIKIIIEQLSMDGQYKEAYNKCLQCMEEGVAVEYAKMKSTELVKQMRSANKKNNAKVWCLVLLVCAVSTVLVAFIQIWWS